MRVDEGIHLDLNAVGLRVAVVTALFNASVTKGLHDGAIEYLEEAEAEEILSRVQSPGAFELPLLAKKIAESGYHAVVCLGAVIEGDTDHYEHVAHRASEGLDAGPAGETGIPVAFGILTVRDPEHATVRGPSPARRTRAAKPRSPR